MSAQLEEEEVQTPEQPIKVEEEDGMSAQLEEEEEVQAHEQPIKVEEEDGMSAQLEEVEVQDPEQAITVEEEDEEDDSSNREEGKPRQWLIDRVDGKERIMAPGSRPYFSAFWTPPILKCFPDILETNCILERLGAIGLIKPTNNQGRKWIMGTAFLITIVGWAFLIYSDLAISTSYNLIDVAPFNIGSIVPKPCLPSEFCENFNETNNDFALQATRYSLGLKAVAFSRGSGNTHSESNNFVAGFDEFCDGDQGFYFVTPEDCNRCEEASRAMVASNIMATITYFFTFTTDILRIWPNYDVNCQKVFGGFFAVFSAVLGVRTFFLFRNQCHESFREGWFCFDSELNEVECDNPGDDFFGSVYFHWQAGSGLVALGIATFAKVLDLLCNIAVPTPTITRNREEQWEYERIAQQAMKEDEEDENGVTQEEEGMESGDGTDAEES